MSINAPIVKVGTKVGVEPTALEDLDRSGTAFPDIENIIFNESTSKTRAKRDENGNLVIDPQTEKPVRETYAVEPTLATTIYFADGSKVTVTNSKNDAVMGPDGKFTEESYERGVIYAIVKRLFGEYVKTANGIELKCEGFGRKLKELVNSAYNVKKAEAERKAAKEAASKRHAELEAAAKANPRRPRKSLGATVAELADTVAKLSAVVEAIQAKQEA